MTPTQRGPATTFFATFVLFFGGGLGGAALAHVLAPDSVLGAFVGLLALPIAFMTGVQLWLGFALFSALLLGLRRLLGQVPRPDPTLAVLRGVPPGSTSFVLTSLAASAIAGVAMAFVATRLGFLATLATWLLVGAVYGLACWRLARSGYLPFPE